MNYAQIREFDIANGEGIRTTIFVSGCTIHCPNCFNKEYQDFGYGTVFSDETMQYILSCVSNPNVSGLSVLGGEPLDQDETLLRLLQNVKTIPQKSIWLWTGHIYENLTEKQKLLVHGYVDVLIDGQFVDALKDLRLKFRGSSNQRVIDIASTITNKKITLKY